MEQKKLPFNSRVTDGGAGIEQEEKEMVILRFRP